MKPNEIYFERNSGSWDWLVIFEISNYFGLWQSDLKLITKLRVSTFSLTQKIFGSFQMWTNVNFLKDMKRVQHSTRLSKWGITFYRSEKTFFIESDGCGIKIEGVEYFWPFISKPSSFQPVFGSIDSSTTSASYKMPLAGTFCDCQTHLGQQDGYIDISTSWLKGRFTLSEESRRILASRLLRP
jgi:hypothetical protein